MTRRILKKLCAVTISYSIIHASFLPLTAEAYEIELTPRARLPKSEHLDFDIRVAQSRSTYTQLQEAASDGKEHRLGEFSFKRTSVQGEIRFNSNLNDFSFLLSSQGVMSVDRMHSIDDMRIRSFGNIKLLEAGNPLSADSLDISGHTIRNFGTLHLGTLQLGGVRFINEEGGTVSFSNRFLSTEQLHVLNHSKIGGLKNAQEFRVQNLTNTENASLSFKSVLTLQTKSLENHGSLYVPEDQILSVHKLVNHGLIQGLGNINFRVKTFVKLLGTITSKFGNLIFNVGGIFNFSQGLLEASKAIALDVKKFIGAAGTLWNSQSAQILARLAITSATRIKTEDDISFTAGKCVLHQPKGILESRKGQVTLDAESMVNEGLISGENGFQLLIKNGATNKKTGQISSRGVGYFQIAGSLENEGLIAADSFTGKLEDVKNQGTFSAGAQTLTLGTVDNGEDAEFTANTLLQLATRSFVNRGHFGKTTLPQLRSEPSTLQIHLRAEEGDLELGGHVDGDTVSLETYIGSVYLNTGFEEVRSLNVKSGRDIHQTHFTQTREQIEFEANGIISTKNLVKSGDVSFTSYSMSLMGGIEGRSNFTLNILSPHGGALEYLPNSLVAGNNLSFFFAQHGVLEQPIMTEGFLKIETPYSDQASLKILTTIKGKKGVDLQYGACFLGEADNGLPEHDSRAGYILSDEGLTRLHGITYCGQNGKIFGYSGLQIVSSKEIIHGTPFQKIIDVTAPGAPTQKAHYYDSNGAVLASQGPMVLSAYAGGDAIQINFATLYSGGSLLFVTPNGQVLNLGGSIEANGTTRFRGKYVRMLPLVNAAELGCIQSNTWTHMGDGRSRFDATNCVKDYYSSPLPSLIVDGDIIIDTEEGAHFRRTDISASGTIVNGKGSSIKTCQNIIIEKQLLRQWGYWSGGRVVVAHLDAYEGGNFDAGKAVELKDVGTMVAQGYFQSPKFVTTFRDKFSQGTCLQNPRTPYYQPIHHLMNHVRPSGLFCLDDTQTAPYVSIPTVPLSVEFPLPKGVIIQPGGFSENTQNLRYFFSPVQLAQVFQKFLMSKEGLRRGWMSEEYRSAREALFHVLQNSRSFAEAHGLSNSSGSNCQELQPVNSCQMSWIKNHLDKNMLIFFMPVNFQGEHILTPTLYLPPKYGIPGRRRSADAIFAKQIVIHGGKSSCNPLLIGMNPTNSVASSQSVMPESDPRGNLVIRGHVAADDVRVIHDASLQIPGQVVGDAILLASLESDVVIASRVKREGVGVNFYDTIPLPAKLHARKILRILSARDVLFKAAETESGLKTHIRALGRILDIPAVLVSQRIQAMGGKYKGVEKFIQAISVPSVHKSDGAFVQESTDEQVSHGALYTADSIAFQSRKSITFHDIFHRYYHEYSGERATFWGSKKISGSSQRTISQGAQFHTTGSKPLSVRAGDISLTAPRITGGSGAEFWAPRGYVEILLGRNTFESVSQSSSKGAIWNKAVQSQERHLTFTLPHIEGPLEIHALKTITEALSHRKPQWLAQLESSDGDVVTRYLSEQHYHHEEVHMALGGPAAAVISIAVSCVTAGAGGALVAPLISSMAIEGTIAAATLTAAANAAVSSIASQAAISFISNQGDMGAVVKDLTSTQALRSLSTSILTASACGGLCEALDIPAPTGAEVDLSDRIQQALVSTGMHTASETLLGDMDLGEALLSGIRAGAANVAGGALAHELGLEYKDPDTSLDYFTHKILHAAIGAGMSVLADHDILSGALGAAVGEIVGEMYHDAHDGELDPSNPEWQTLRERGINLSKVSAATVAAFLARDPYVAAHAAENAVRENALNPLRPLIALDSYLTSSSSEKENQKLSELSSSLEKEFNIRVSPAALRKCIHFADPLLRFISGNSGGVGLFYIDSKKFLIATVKGIAETGNTGREIAQELTSALIGGGYIANTMGVLGHFTGTMFGILMTVGGPKGGGRSHRTRGIVPVCRKNGERAVRQSPYDAYAWREFLEHTYGRDSVSSTTLPARGARGTKFYGARYPGIIYDDRRRAVFDHYVVYDTLLPWNKFFKREGMVITLQPRKNHFRAATSDLAVAIRRGEVSKDYFTPGQLHDIFTGKPKIQGYTWEHHPDLRRMQLLPETIHAETPHTGSVGMIKSDNSGSYGR